MRIMFDENGKKRMVGDIKWTTNYGTVKIDDETCVFDWYMYNDELYIEYVRSNKIISCPEFTEIILSLCTEYCKKASVKFGGLS